MILTQGEKMVWAAAFAVECNEFYERNAGTMLRAVETASEAVETLRTAGRVAGVNESGLSFNAHQMLRAMLGDEG